MFTTVPASSAPGKYLFLYYLIGRMHVLEMTKDNVLGTMNFASVQKSDMAKS